MTTNTAGSAARLYQTEQVHYLVAPVVYTKLSTTIGKLPAGSCVIDAGIVVTTAFAGGTPQTLDIGVTGDLEDFASDIVLTTIGVIKADALATATSSYATADIDAVATLTAGATVSAGAGYAYVAYIMANRGA